MTVASPPARPMQEQQTRRVPQQTQEVLLTAQPCTAQKELVLIVDQHTSGPKPLRKRTQTERQPTSLELPQDEEWSRVPSLAELQTKSQQRLDPKRLRPGIGCVAIALVRFAASSWRTAHPSQKDRHRNRRRQQQALATAASAIEIGARTHRKGQRHEQRKSGPWRTLKCQGRHELAILGASRPRARRL